MLENVMSYNNYGIVVGTIEIIPEPGTLILACGFGLLATVARRSR
jgi:hypothetical protein